MTSLIQLLLHDHPAQIRAATDDDGMVLAWDEMMMSEIQQTSIDGSRLSKYLAYRTQEVLRRCASDMLVTHVLERPEQKLVQEQTPVASLEVNEPKKLHFPVFDLMLRAERRRMNRLPKPTKRELEEAETLAAELGSQHKGFIINDKPQLKSKLVLATCKKQRSPKPSTGSELYDVLVASCKRRQPKTENIAPGPLAAPIAKKKAVSFVNLEAQACAPEDVTLPHRATTPSSKISPAKAARSVRSPTMTLCREGSPAKKLYSMKSFSSTQHFTRSPATTPRSARSGATTPRATKSRNKWLAKVAVPLARVDGGDERTVATIEFASQNIARELREMLGKAERQPAASVEEKDDLSKTLLRYVEDIDLSRDLPEVSKAKQKHDVEHSAERVLCTLRVFYERISRKAMCRWKATAAWLTQRAMHDAQLLLLRAARRYLAWKELKERRLYRDEQAARERHHLAVAVVAPRERAATRLQCSSRRWLAVRKASAVDRLIQCARNMQRHHRGRLARTVMAFARAKHRALTCAAIACQRRRRGILGRRRSWMVAAVRRTALLIDIMERRHERTRHQLRIHGAAFAIQSRWRHRKHERVERVRARLRVARGLSTICATVRHFLERARRRRLRDEEQRILLAKTRVANWLQSNARRRCAVRRTDSLWFEARVNAVVRRKYRECKLRRRLRGRCWRSACRAYRRTIAAAFGLSASLAATKIAAMYRGHRARSRVRLIRLRARVRAKADHIARRHQAATTVTTRARMVIAQRAVEAARSCKTALKIQTAVRAALGRRRLKVQASRWRAVIKLQAVWRCRAAAAATRHRVLYERACRRETAVVQARVRTFVAKRRAIALREGRRRLAEASLKARNMLCRYKRVTRAELALESYEASAEYRGEFQAVFAHFCRTRPPKRNKNERLQAPAVKIVRTVASTASQARVSAARQLSRLVLITDSKIAQQQHATDAMIGCSELVKLFKESGLLENPGRGAHRDVKNRKFLSASDVELAFMREKFVGEKLATYAQFLSMLDGFGAVLRPGVNEWPGGAKDGAARASSLLFTDFLTKPWGRHINKVLDERAEAVLTTAATLIQRRFRSISAKRREEHARERREKGLQNALECCAAVKIQARLSRGPAARRVVQEVARTVYRKYVVEREELHHYVDSPLSSAAQLVSSQEHKVDPIYYWAFVDRSKADGSQPRTTWTKPRLLGDGDVERVTLRPNKNTAFVADCAYCLSRPARTLCLDSCGDAYCEACWASLHRRGRRARHTKKVIPTCVDCGDEQPASRSCATCSATERRQCTLCDTCFHNRHGSRDECETQSQAQREGTESEGWNAADALEARRAAAKRTVDLRRKAAWMHNTTRHSKMVSHARAEARRCREHRWIALVEMCGMCGDYAARWACDSCAGQLFCGGCCSILHSRGARLKHTCRRLTYYSAHVKKRYACLRREETKCIESEAVARKVRTSLAERRQRAATQLQAVWRRKMDSRRGVQLMRSRRRIERMKWAKRRQEDRAQRKTLKFKVLDVLGRAPDLPSDTRREAVLKRIPVWRRSRAAYFVEQNVWVAPSNLKHRPRRGFESYDLDVLRLQAQVGGVALPAFARPKAGSCIVEVTCVAGFSLESRVRPGNRLRLGSTLVEVAPRCDAVKRDRLTLRYCWRDDTTDQLPIFRLPPVVSVFGKLVLQIRREAYENVASQMVLEGVIKGVSVVASLEKRVARKFRSSNPPLANVIKRASKRHYCIAQHLRWRTVAYQFDVRAHPSRGESIQGEGSSTNYKPATRLDAVPVQATLDEREAAKEVARQNAYLGNARPEHSDWVKFIEASSGRMGWKNEFSGECTFEKPYDLKSQAELDFERAKQHRLATKQRRAR